MPGTPAERAGIGRVPVIVTAVDGVTVDGTMRDWCDATTSKATGDAVQLRVIEPRSGTRRTIRLEFA